MESLKRLIWMGCLVQVLFGVPASAADKPVYPSTLNDEVKKEETAPPPVEPLYVGQPLHPCEAVTCGGHGQCIVMKGYPVCACEVGYLPDRATGLHCLPQQQMNPRGAAQTRELDNRRYIRETRRLAVREAQSALRNHVEYPALRKKKGWGLAGVIIGAVGMGMGGMVAMTAEFEGRAAAVSGGIALGSFVLFLPSVIALSTAKGRIREIYRHELDRHKHEMGLALTGVGPVITPDGQGAGVGASFKF